MGEHPNGGDALREEALSNNRREERILPLLCVENIPGYSEQQQAAGYRAALLRSSTWGLSWQCMASPEPSLQHQEKCMKSLGSPGV